MYRCWAASFSLDDDDCCDEAEYIPRRGKLVTKPTKPTKEKTYILSTLTEDIEKCQHKSTCECRYFFKSFCEDTTTYKSWKLNIIKQYDQLNKEAKLRYIQQWIHFREPVRGRPESRKSSYPKSFFYIFPDYNGYSRILCKNVFNRLLNFKQTSHTKNLSTIWKHRTSGDLTLNLADECGKSDDPHWLKHFENWLLKNIPYQCSHYSVKKIPYLAVQSLRGKTLLPKHMFVPILTTS